MKRISLLVALALGAVAAVIATAAAAPAATAIPGSVGPGFTISLTKKTVPAGLYTFRINDRSSIHNFHLRGVGVNRAITTVGATGIRTYTVRLKRGTYTFVCDPHASQMHGTLRVT